jgi:hypothetical protein
MAKTPFLVIALVLTGCAQKNDDVPTKGDILLMQARLDEIEKKLEPLVHDREIQQAAVEAVTRRAKMSEAEQESDRVRKLKEGQARVEGNAKMMCDALPGQCNN